MIPRSVCMLFLWVGVGLGTECPLAGGVACESNIGGFCNPTQRDCIRVREPALVSLAVICAMRATGNLYFDAFSPSVMCVSFTTIYLLHAVFV